MTERLCKDSHSPRHTPPFPLQITRRTTIMFQTNHLLTFKHLQQTATYLLYYRNSSTLLPQIYPTLIISVLHSYGTKMFPQFE